MDSDHQADQAWLLGVQRKLYQWSWENPAEPYRDLWNWVIDPRNLRCAWRSIAINKGRRTPGVDGETVESIASLPGVSAFLDGLRDELRSGSYRPSPARRVWIPKRRKPGKFRPLGIPTVADRVVQCAVKQILEPIFEARFWHVSYGFRPGRGCHGALEHIRQTIMPRNKVEADGKRHAAPYQWIIEGDIEGCFDNIDHHLLLNRVRRAVADRKVNRLIVGFLKAGVLEDFIYNPTASGTPQGGVISPLLANIALGVIEERYGRWVNRIDDLPRRCDDGASKASGARWGDKKAGRPVFYPVRYADDFVVLVAGSREDALAERQALADWIGKNAGLRLSPEKTRITKLTEGFQFLGCRVRIKWDERYGLTPRIEIPRSAIRDFRYRVKQATATNSIGRPLSKTLADLNPVLQGWSAYYRYCVGAKPILSQLDWYVDQRVWRWMRKKHRKTPGRKLAALRRPARNNPMRKVWADRGTEQYVMSTRTVMRFMRGWMRKPDYAIAPGEPDA